MSQSSSPELVLTVKEAATMLKCSEKTILRKIAKGILIPIAGFRCHRIPKLQVIALIKAAMTQLIEGTSQDTR